MLRINLLPPYIYDSSKRRNVTVLWAVVLAAVVGAMIFWKVTLDGQADEIKKATEARRGDADKADQLKAQAGKITTASAEIKAKADFARDAIKHDQETYPQAFNNVRDF